jgi:hypothetical protein
MKIFLKFPDNLPLIGVIWGFSIGLSYFGSLMFGELIIGRPSSTWAIGLLWLPAYAALPAIGGLALGFAFKLLFRKLNIFHELPAISLLLLILPLIFSMYVSTSIGLKKIKALEALSSPHVVLTNGKVIKLSRVPVGNSIFMTASLVWSLSSDKVPVHFIIWNKKQIAVESVENRIIVSDGQKQVLIETDLSSFNYVRELYAIPFKYDLLKEDALAVIANLRATSNRSMLLIYNADNILIYQEILHRTGIADDPLEVIHLPNKGEELLIVKVNTPVFYGGKELRGVGLE